MKKKEYKIGILNKVEDLIMNNEEIIKWSIIALEHYKECDISDREREEIEKCLEELYKS